LPAAVVIVPPDAFKPLGAAPIPNCFTIDAKEVTIGAINQYLLYPPLTFESIL
jgi:hypothetical protein